MTGKIRHPLGENPTGHIVYTKGGHVGFSLLATTHVSSGDLCKDAEPITLFSTLGAASGTYRGEGNTILASYTASANQTWSGTTHKRQFEIMGMS